MSGVDDAAAVNDDVDNGDAGADNGKSASFFFVLCICLLSIRESS